MKLFTKPTKTQRRQAYPHRRGGVLLLCMLAAVVVSSGTIALVHLHRRSSQRIDARRCLMETNQESRGLYERVTTMIRNDPSFSGNVTSVTGTQSAYAVVTSLAPSQTNIRVYAYRSSTQPVMDVVVDPAQL